MKNIVTLCFLALMLSFGVQNANAQDQSKINSIANQKAIELRKSIKFDDNTLEEVYQAYKLYETKMHHIEVNLTSDPTVAAQSKNKTKDEFNDKLKSIFTEEQYEKYLSLER